LFSYDDSDDYSEDDGDDDDDGHCGDDSDDDDHCDGDDKYIDDDVDGDDFMFCSYSYVSIHHPTYITIVTIYR